MDPKKKAKLEAAGWTVGDYGDFLALTPAEREVVELRVQLARTIRTLRTNAGMSQQDLATKMNTTQPRVVKIERAAKDVSMDVLVRGVLTLGGKVMFPQAVGEKAGRYKAAKPPAKRSGGKRARG